MGYKPTATEKRAQNTLNDHTIPYFTDYDYSYWRSSNSTRENLGYEYARDNYRLITEGMKAGLDKFNFISHSMGGAFSEGMMKYMTEQGWQIEHAIFLNAWEPTEIDTKVEGIRIDATCTNDWVQQLSIPITGDSNIPHSDLRIQINSNESFMKIHRDLIDGRNNDLWNMINKILSK